MTREEELEKIAIGYGLSISDIIREYCKEKEIADGIGKITQFVFKLGVSWADANPQKQWKPTKEQMKDVQSRQNIKWSEKDDEYHHGIIMYLLNNEIVGVKDKENAISWFKSLKGRVAPQTKQEWGEEDKENLEDVIKVIKNLNFTKGSEADTDRNRLVSWVNSLKDRVIPQEWSEEDLEHLEIAEESCQFLNKIETVNWLKSIRPQKQQKWDKHDIEMIEWLIRCCEKEHKELCNDRYGHQDIVSDLKRDCRKKWDWLESLKNKVVPQKQWKPTEEQMIYLKAAIKKYNWCDGEYCGLLSLYEQLKQLKQL